MAVIRSFDLSSFYRDGYHQVKKGEYVILVVYSEDNPSLSYSKNPEKDLNGILKDFNLVYKSPVHYNNTHVTAGLRTLILEKVN